MFLQLLLDERQHLSCRKIYLPLVIRCQCLFISIEINFHRENKTHCHFLSPRTRCFANVNCRSLCYFVSGVFCFMVIRWINLLFRRTRRTLTFPMISASRAISRVVKMEFFLFCCFYRRISTRSSGILSFRLRNLYVFFTCNEC